MTVELRISKSAAASVLRYQISVPPRKIFYSTGAEVCPSTFPHGYINFSKATSRARAPSCPSSSTGRNSGMSRLVTKFHRKAVAAQAWLHPHDHGVRVFEPPPNLLVTR